jgi:phage shock protein C
MAKKIKRLYRSNKDRLLGGVCGGIAEYLGIDPISVRLAWVFFTLFSFGAGILLYIIAWVVIPRKPNRQ